MGSSGLKLNSKKILMRIAELNLSKKDFAEKAGLSLTTVNAALKRGSCRLENFGKIAKALGISVEDIILREEA